MEEHDVEDIEGEVRDEELDPERAARRRLALAQIRQYPDAALKMKARPVAEFDDELQSLVERMKLLMHDANGIGLAATQVGVLRRLFVFQPNEEDVLRPRQPGDHGAERRDRRRRRGVPLDPGRSPSRSSALSR